MTESFIQRAISKHGNKYDYSKVEYKKALQKITIICKKHGEFEQKPSSHLYYGCKQCGIESSANARRSNKDDFITNALQIHGDKYDYSKVNYIKCQQKVTIICKEHGEFKQTPAHHLSKQGCYKCAIEKNADNNRSNTYDFIQKALVLFGNIYDYSKVYYVNNHTKVIIICKKHGEFEQIPNSHLSKQGCYKCAIEKNADNNRSNTKDFINKALEIHQNKYDYSKVVYENTQKYVTIVCKHHGDFFQKPGCHLSGHGCQKCGGSIKKTTAQFINDSNVIHNSKYDYSKTDYVNTHFKVTIICKEHGEFLQIAKLHIKGHGCPSCSNCKRKTTQSFIEECKLVHGQRYDYSKVVYKNTLGRVAIICKEHGEFEQIAMSHLIGQGCPRCGNLMKALSKTKSVYEFIQRSKQIHGDKYDYSQIINYYKDFQTPINIICKEHGEFQMRPIKHIHRKQGCPECQTQKKYSKAQIEWLNFLQLKDSITIQHALNSGEFVIPTTNYKADGYCKETNTIYEFHGDYWHGNPDIYTSDSYNKTTKCSFGELYKKTIKKEKQLIGLGYNIVVMWENTWESINRCIRTLQKQYKLNRG